MRVFVTGATGFIGSAIVQELLSAGHQVLGLARSNAGAKALTAAKAEVHRGSLEDLDSLKRGAAAVDGVIHTAFIHDFSDFAASARTDERAIEAMTAMLARSGKPFIVTAGTLGFSPGRLAAEDDSPAGSLARRSESAGLAAAAHGVRAIVIRLPPSVHGDGDHGFVPALMKLAREKRFAVYVGEGRNRWPAVHRLDVAKVYRLALENGTAGARFHGVADEGIPVREIAVVIGRRLNVLPFRRPPRRPPSSSASSGTRSPWTGRPRARSRESVWDGTRPSRGSFAISKRDATSRPEPHADRRFVRHARTREYACSCTGEPHAGLLAAARTRQYACSCTGRASRCLPFDARRRRASWPGRRAVCSLVFATELRGAVVADGVAHGRDVVRSRVQCSPRGKTVHRRA